MQAARPRCARAFPRKGPPTPLLPSRSRIHTCPPSAFVRLRKQPPPRLAETTHFGPFFRGVHTSHPEQLLSSAHPPSSPSPRRISPPPSARPSPRLATNTTAITTITTAITTITTTLDSAYSHPPSFIPPCPRRPAFRATAPPPPPRPPPRPSPQRSGEMIERGLVKTATEMLVELSREVYQQDFEQPFLQARAVQAPRIVLRI
eukprot:176763-Pleurochrysis_carterae.AAC.1